MDKELDINKTDKDNASKNRRITDIVGVVAILGSIYLSLSIFTYNKWDTSLFTYSTLPSKNYGGLVGAYISDFIFAILGLAGYILPIIFIFYGILLILRKNKDSKLYFLGGIFFLISLSLFFDLIGKYLSTDIQAGGLVGYTLRKQCNYLFADFGSYLVSITLMIIGLIIMSPVSIFEFIHNIKKQRSILKEQSKKEKLIVEIQQKPEQKVLLTQSEITSQREDNHSQPTASQDGYKLPSINLLSFTETGKPPTKEELNLIASELGKKLVDFEISGIIKQVYPGPVVTMYEFEPAPGVKIQRIISLADDLALAIKAQSIRIYPITGKAAIGIEIPNAKRATVFLKEIIASETFQNSNSLLTCVLGKDISGNPVVTDLTKMPHLLIAGVTGSGKSIFINTMIVSLLYKASPQEVKLLLIDPKLLELSAYTNIPHLFAPLITTPKDASEGLKKMVLEMERRYKLLAEKGMRNIENYNKVVEISERLPYIVIFIDELADLMFTSPMDVEGAITRLTQMARASGIHLVLATQRPSVDVITGLIKANIPARISFQVASKIDSRTILDAQGSEQLLGMGDMLFMMPGLKTIRVHGAYISEQDINRITNFIMTQGKPDYSPYEDIIVSNPKGGHDENEAEGNDLYQKVFEIGRTTGEISISLIQRKLKIGYNKAATIMDILEQDGLVGPPKGAGKARDFLG